MSTATIKNIITAEELRERDFEYKYSYNGIDVYFLQNDTEPCHEEEIFDIELNVRGNVVKVYRGKEVIFHDTVNSLEELDPLVLMWVDIDIVNYYMANQKSMI